MVECLEGREGFVVGTVEGGGGKGEDTDKTVGEGESCERVAGGGDGEGCWDGFVLPGLVKVGD